MLMAEDTMTVCDFCHQRGVIWQMEEMRFRQWSDKGYVQCRAELAVGTCENCGMKSLELDSEQILDAAFHKEYRKLP
jgi:ssDNA-binding Zn-finger/Zn-ribbon topoisomerase 1